MFASYFMAAVPQDGTASGDAQQQTSSQVTVTGLLVLCVSG
jgi:hypothetical protein